MYLTEEEAKGKWCPQVRFTRQTSLWNWLRNISTYIANRYLKNRGNELSINESSKCIASECMMWKFNYQSVECNNFRQDPVIGIEDMCYCKYLKIDHPVKKKGHCGLTK